MAEWKVRFKGYREILILHPAFIVCASRRMSNLESYYFYISGEPGDLEYDTMEEAKRAAKVEAKKLLTEALKNLGNKCAKCGWTNEGQCPNCGHYDIT